jgi:hypothetical protein
MENVTLTQVREAIQHMQAVERALMLGVHQPVAGFNANDLLKDHRKEDKRWEVTQEPPQLVAQLSWREDGEPASIAGMPKLPRLKTLFHEKDETLSTFVGRVADFIRTLEDQQSVLLNFGIHYQRRSAHLSVVDAEAIVNTRPLTLDERKEIYAATATQPADFSQLDDEQAHAVLDAAGIPTHGPNTEK